MRQYRISENAIKLGIVLNTMEYSQSETAPLKKVELKKSIKAASEILYSEKIKSLCDKNYLTILVLMQIAKAIQDDEMEIKTYNHLYNHLIKNAKSDELIGYLETIFKTHVNVFADDETIDYQAQLLLSMGVKIEDAYKELDLLQVDIFNKPIFIDKE